MQIDVLNIEGKATGRTIDLPEEIFGIEPNNHAIYLAIKQYLGAQRQGTHKVKTRAEVKGSSKIESALQKNRRCSYIRPV